jgi:hypothetical protein
MADYGCMGSAAPLLSRPARFKHVAPLGVYSVQFFARETGHHRVVIVIGGYCVVQCSLGPESLYWGSGR